jgi:hypothetical protein
MTEYKIRISKNFLVTVLYNRNIEIEESNVIKITIPTLKIDKLAQVPVIIWIPIFIKKANRTESMSRRKYHPN